MPRTTRTLRTVRPSRPTVAFATGLATVFLVTSCSAPTETTDGHKRNEDNARTTVSITNCATEVDYEVPAQRMFVNDSNLTSIALSAGAGDNIAALTINDKDIHMLKTVYGEEFTSLPIVADRPSMEVVLAQDTDLMFAGWSYGFSEERGFTPDMLAERGIASYILSESCRSSDSTRGIMEPWDALEADLRNVATLAGDTKRADDVIKNINERRAQLDAAPQAETPPTAFLFDSGTDSVYTSGSFGAPQAIVEAAGARNATEGIADTWTQVGWESIAAEAPDVFVFVDYPPQTLAEKIAVLREHPVTRDLPAVREGRFINLPYMMWTSGPLNIDAAELVRKGLEHYRLVPESEISPVLEVSDLGVDGNDWAR